MNALSSGNLKKDYARFVVPTVVSLAVFSLYSMVDGIFVGRLIGPEAAREAVISALAGTQTELFVAPARERMDIEVQPCFV